MADKKFEPDDPMELVGTVCTGADESSVEEMACAFVEEFARTGWRREDVIAIFMDPFYRGPHTIYRVKGLRYVETLLDQFTGWPQAGPPGSGTQVSVARPCAGRHNEQTGGARLPRIIPLKPV